MIKLLVNHEYAYDTANIVRLFCGKEQLDMIDLRALEDNQGLFQVEDFILHSELAYHGSQVEAKADLLQGGMRESCVELYDLNSGISPKNMAKLTMYKLLSRFYKKTYPWGILTGIRPIKLVHQLMDKEYVKEDIKAYLQKNYLMSEQKSDLAIQIAAKERKFLYPLDNNKVSVYIGIPFCPTRCSYCSFTSNPIGKNQDLVDRYLNALIFEMEQTSVEMNKFDLQVQTIYIGGGTPTSLNEEQLQRLLTKTVELFGSKVIEFTCEAGRPDTITEEKLKVMKQNGVTRISINPQTMNEETLKAIGRAHSVEQTIASFKLARKLGFDNINMDLILGLPREGMREVSNTLAEISGLGPDSITIHTLAIKRASQFHEKPDRLDNCDNEAEALMEKALQSADQMGMKPYYLYRQKHMVENLENIGCAKPGYECIYNIQIIEEKQTNIAFGADAITKTVDLSTDLIKRQGNIKDVGLYIDNIQSQLDKKLQLLSELYHEVDHRSDFE